MIQITILQDYMPMQFPVGAWSGSKSFPNAFYLVSASLQNPSCMPRILEGHASRVEIKHFHRNRFWTAAQQWMKRAMFVSLPLWTNWLEVELIFLWLFLEPMTRRCHFRLQKLKICLGYFWTNQLAVRDWKLFQDATKFGQPWCDSREEWALTSRCGQGWPCWTNFC